MKLATVLIVAVYCVVLTTQHSDKDGRHKQNGLPLVPLNSGGSIQRERRQSLDANNSSSDIENLKCLNIELLRGRDGRDGPPGKDGQNGLPGRDGRDGMPGAQGPRGEPESANGPPGPRGLQGERGSTGATGRQGPPGPRSGGVVYTRWGKSSCPSVPGTRMVYAGRAGSSHHLKGGASNYLCMPNDPQYTLSYRSGVQGQSYMYTTEYEDPIIGVDDFMVPCAVCAATTRNMLLMIPAKTSCPTSWTREYYGYLMAQHIDYHPTTFECVDRAQESVPHSQVNVNGAQFRHVEAHCSGLACPPYNSYKELNCVVCTK